MVTPLLHLDNISKSYPGGGHEVRALDGVSLDIYEGEFVAIMGQSGSGKSTLMNIIGCLDRPSAGSYKIKGVEAHAYNSNELAKLRRDHFGFIFQRYNLLNNATAEENIEIPAIYAGIGKANRLKRAKELLKNLGISDRGDHRPSELSGGQQQRVAIARALVNNPAVILADEPTGALDSRSGQEVIDVLKDLNAQGHTIILITHDETIAKNAQRIVNIHDGKITNDSQPLAKFLQPSLEKSAPIKGTHSILLPDISEAIKMAFRSLRVNLFRTVLTLLGIIIGVASVITMLAIGNGSKQNIVNQISQMGSNLLAIRPGAPGDSERIVTTLLPDDVDSIDNVANVDAAMPQRQQNYTLRYNDLEVVTVLVSTNTAMSKVRDWPVAKGNFFTERDIKNYAPVIVLGSTIADTLFPTGRNPIGKYILVEKTPFQVIGVLASKGHTANGLDQDETSFIPITTGITTMFGNDHLDSIMVRVKNIKKIDKAQDDITKLLKLRHNEQDFTVANMATVIAMMSRTQDTLTTLLAAVAAISLLVGGIGVMNIMLVSVTERTREIGIRVATGARRRDILLQFNTEAAVVCAVGGVLGILAGIGTSLIVEHSGVSVVFTVWPPVLAFISASATGLFFGYLPARKAAHLDPVIALASE